jgi:hypothetical protein
MVQYTNAERLWIVEHYFRSFGQGRNGGPSLKKICDSFIVTFNKAPPTNAAILAMVKKFRQDGSVQNQNASHSGRKRTISANDNCGIIFQKVLESPTKSTRRISLETQISHASVRRILRDLGAFSYRIQMLQTLTPVDRVSRKQFCARVLAQHYMDPYFLRDWWWSDECHVYLCGQVNKQNSRYLAWEKPNECLERPLHSEKVTLWLAASSHGIIGPYFIQDQDGGNITVTGRISSTFLVIPVLFFEQNLSVASPITGAVYREQIIQRFEAELQLFCDLKGVDFDQQIFQQDGASAHTSKVNMELLNELFPCRLVSRGSEFPFPSHSPDLTLPDAFIWGIVKENCYYPVPRSTHELRENIYCCLQKITECMLKSMVANMVQRLELCLQKDGAHFEHMM